MFLLLLQTSQIGTDSLVLEWQVPNWDGGSAITNYVIEKQETFQVPKVIEEEEQGLTY